MFRPWNVYIVASISGKLIKELFIECLIRIYLPNAGPRSILLIDSWTGHCPSTLQNNVPSNQRVEIFAISKETTALIQPLDAYDFRIWKSFVQTFSDIVALFNYDIDLQLRNNVIQI